MDFREYVVPHNAMIFRKSLVPHCAMDLSVVLAFLVMRLGNILIRLDLSVIMEFSLSGFLRIF